MEPLNLADFEALARTKLPRPALDYYAGGAGDNVTLRENEAAFQKIALRPRVLVGVGKRDLATRVLGAGVSMPVLVAPTAFHGLAHEDAERATARATGKAGTVMVLSTLSNVAVEDVVLASSGPVWFQLYVYKDRAVTKDLVERAVAAGCRALVLTVDAPLLGRREADVRNGFHLPPGLEAKNLLPANLAKLGKTTGDSGLAAYFATLLDPDLSWNDVDWLRSIAEVPVVVKGIQRGDDAARAVEHGASAIVVSNHGGRQLDTAAPTIATLEEVRDAVAGRCEVYLDGGVRRGTDVLKAIALGANAVLVGRPVLWGLAVGGESGVSKVLGLLREELDLAMALAGCRTIGEITRDLIHG